MNYTSSILAPSFLPSVCVLEMTYKCNHKCLFCSCPWENDKNRLAKQKELTLDEWKTHIKKLCSMGITSFSLSGGEPLLFPQLKELIKFIRTECVSLYFTSTDQGIIQEYKAPGVYIVSNGSLINREWLEFFKKYDVKMSMSLPGLTTYRKHTGIGSAQNILDNFKLAKEIGVTTTVNIAVTKINFPELFDTIAEALIAGAGQLLMNRFLPGGRGVKYDKKLLLSWEQTREMLDIAEEVLVTANRYGSVGTELPYCLFKDKKFTNLTVGTGCSAGKGFFVVGPSGMIRACNHSPIELVHINEIEKLPQHSYWQKFVKKDYAPKMCLECADLSFCDGGCREAAHIIGGSPDASDVLFL